METIMNYLPPLPSFWYICLGLLCVDDVSSKLDIQDVKRTKACGKFDWFCYPRFLQPNLNQMQNSSVQYQQYAYAVMQFFNGRLSLQLACAYG